MISQTILPHQKIQDHQVQSFRSTILYFVNMFIIILNFVVMFYLHQPMILLAAQGEYQFLALHGLHLYFTFYNLIFTAFHWEPNHYFEGLMSLLSFFITAYSIASILAMTYWVLFLENEPTGQAFAVVFITLFIVFPGIQTFTYRMYRSERNSSNVKLIPVYADVETMQRMQAQKAHLMI
mmetsp:Transcript_1406/g.1248  ORF Transcript_1406/g.1248 Transcript_1406/m.1248 type:complete len:180 (-) Transcript_1406:47-586(-)